MITNLIKKISYIQRKFNPLISPRFIHYRKDVFFDLSLKKFTQLTPNLIIIGAQKSGTTALAKYLNLHPSIFLSNPLKEPGFFIEFGNVRDYLRNRGYMIFSKYDLLKNYMLQGYNGEKYFMDASTYYTLGNISYEQNIPKKIFDNNSKSKLLYIIRHPFERILSNIWHIVKDTDNINDSINIDVILKKNPELYFTSLYSYQLKNYIQYFKDIKIILFEEFINDSQKTFNEICGFLQIDNIACITKVGKINQSYNQLNMNLLHESNYFNKIVKKKILVDMVQLSKIINLEIWEIEKS